MLLIKRYKKKSFTLIEVLIFVSILILFFISSITITTYILRNLKVQEHKILATRYAQELLEWLRGKKEEDWDTFISHDGTYCFNESLSRSFPTRGECSNSYSLANYFKREATLTLLNTNPPNTQMKINITVKWIESGGQEHQVPVNTIFSVWE